MGPYLGDFKAGSILYFTWDTNDGNGASINPSVPGTISVYKDDNVVQSVAGITDVRAFDGLVGVHNCKIDTINAFYATGHDYSVILSAATIDTQVVNATLATFSIENRNRDISALALAAIENIILDADLQTHLGVAVGGRNIGNILGQLAQSEFEQRTNVFAIIPVPAQGITLNMVNSSAGCVQYQRVDMSYTKNWAAPDKVYYLLYHYNARHRQDIVKASLGIVW
jgi:hypothetical protein